MAREQEKSQQPVQDLLGRRDLVVVVFRWLCCSRRRRGGELPTLETFKNGFYMGECPRCDEVPVKKILRDRRHHNTDVRDAQNITRSFPTMASSD